MRKLSDISGHGMSIVTGDPPNIAEIAAVFPIVAERFRRNIYFCYGDTLYNPGGRPIAKQIIAHECCHSLQQADWGIENWWGRYLYQRGFSLEQELEAHQIEYAEYCAEGYGRTFRRRYLASVSERLSGPLYNNMVRKAEALRLITEDNP